MKKKRIAAVLGVKGHRSVYLLPEMGWITVANAATGICFARLPRTRWVSSSWQVLRINRSERA